MVDEFNVQPWLCVSVQVKIAKPGKKATGGEQRVVIGRLSRNRRKFVTVVGGLDTFPGEFFVPG